MREGSSCSRDGGAMEQVREGRVGEWEGKAVDRKGGGGEREGTEENHCNVLAYLNAIAFFMS